MELTERFVVPATVDRVWMLFDDIPEVVTCMPGAEVTERVDDKTYNARLTIAVGPIRPKFDVRATIERDDETRTGQIDIHAVDKRGGSQARGQIVYTLHSEGEATAVHLVQQVAISGPLAQFGRTGIIEDINAQMTRQFAECLAAKLTLAAPPGAPENQASAPASSATEKQAMSPPAAASTEIRILPLLSRTIWARILKALRIRK